MARYIGLIAIIGFFNLQASADVRVEFTNENRGDSFTLTNLESCSVLMTDIEIDLGPSIGGVYFDVSAAPPGLNRPQEFNVDLGASYLTEIPQVKDGDNKLVFKFKDFPAQAIIRVSLDTDYGKHGSGAIVYGQEIEGGMVTVTGESSAYFDHTGTAIVPAGGCFS